MFGERPLLVDAAIVLLGHSLDPASHPWVLGRQSRVLAAYIAPVRNGLVIRSWPMLEPGPCPQMKPTSSPSGSNLSIIDLISVSWLPPGMSLRPTEPLNNTSPTWAKRISLLKYTTLPGEWPGQCRMSKLNSPIETRSPSLSQRPGAKSRTPDMPNRAPLVTTL